MDNLFIDIEDGDIIRSGDYQVNGGSKTRVEENIISSVEHQRTGDEKKMKGGKKQKTGYYCNANPKSKSRKKSRRKKSRRKKSRRKKSYKKKFRRRTRTK